MLFLSYFIVEFENNLDSLLVIIRNDVMNYNDGALGGFHDEEKLMVLYEVCASIRQCASTAQW